VLVLLQPLDAPLEVVDLVAKHAAAVNEPLAVARKVGEDVDRVERDAAPAAGDGTRGRVDERAVLLVPARPNTGRDPDGQLVERGLAFVHGLLELAAWEGDDVLVEPVDHRGGRRLGNAIGMPSRALLRAARTSRAIATRSLRGADRGAPPSAPGRSASPGPGDDEPVAAPIATELPRAPGGGVANPLRCGVRRDGRTWDRTRDLSRVKRALSR
jgi:hypothetical protein